MLWNRLLLVAVIGDFAVPYLLAVFYKGYSHKLMVMSSLGNPSSPVRFLYHVWLIALGILLILSTKVVWARFMKVSKPLTIAVVVCMVLFAVGAGILAGLFSVNEEKEIVTTASQIHGISAAIGFMALLFVPLLLGILSYRNQDQTAGLLFILSFVMAFLFFVFFVMADKEQFQNTILRNEGLWQRLTLFFMYVPLGYIAVENSIHSASLK